MLQVRVANIVGYACVSVFCMAHGLKAQHMVWSAVVRAGIEDPVEELRVLSETLAAAYRAHEEGEWSFTDECS